MTEPYPAHIRDNPIMQGAFAAFMDWAWRQDEFHKAHCKATGCPPMLKVSSPLDDMINQETGYEQQYAESFVKWAIKTKWGAEGDEVEGDFCDD